MKQALLIASITLVTTAVPAVAGTQGATPRQSAEAAITLTGGAGSRQELIDDLLQALRTRDANALRRLRVTEEEYRNIIIPGHVPPGQPARDLAPAWRDYAWANLETKSHYHQLRLLEEFGGQSLKVQQVEFNEGEKEYAGYKAYSQLRLKVLDGDGRERELRTGSIAEIGGTYKFISFIRD